MTVDLLHVAYDTGVDAPTPVGRLRFRDGRCYFQFDGGWRAQGRDLSPLQLPPTDIVVEGPPPSRFDGLHPLFQDSLPDGWGRLLTDKAILRSGVNPATLTPIDRLALVGTRAMGALSYLPDEGAKLLEPVGGVVDLTEIAAQAERIYEGSVEDVLPELLRDGGSPMGARPKALLAISENGRAVRSGSLPGAAGFTPHLVKFPARSEGRDAGLVEEAYARMARAAGIVVPPTRVLRTRDRRDCFAIVRFDRLGDRRLHMQTLGAMIGADTTDAVDYETYLSCTLHVTHDQRAVIEAYRRAVFNVFARNRDDHVRNFAYLMQPDGSWVLAPAYDVTFSEGRFGRHALSVAGEDLNVTADHLQSLARSASIGRGAAANIVAEVEAAVADWDRIARDVGVAAPRRRAIEKALDATCRVVRGLPSPPSAATGPAARPPVRPSGRKRSASIRARKRQSASTKKRRNGDRDR
jgi:serine/threonine-protein kinase HipA